jgi:cadmium resistance protein CadD (predicted permease)
MSLPITDLWIGVVVFASTNIDDLFVLVAFFSDPRMRRRSIVIGQYLGIGVLTLLSSFAATQALVIPSGWIALLGVVPLALGLRKLWTLRGDMKMTDEGVQIQARERTVERLLHSQTLAVAGVTVSNGGDNLGVYVPLFATSIDAIATYAFTFMVMTGLWCGLSLFLVNSAIGAPIRRYGQAALPIVLIALGLYILSGALVLVR